MPSILPYPAGCRPSYRCQQPSNETPFPRYLSSLQLLRPTLENRPKELSHNSGYRAGRSSYYMSRLSSVAQHMCLDQDAPLVPQTRSCVGQPWPASSHVATLHLLCP